MPKTGVPVCGLFYRFEIRRERNMIVQKSLEMIGYYEILEKLENCAASREAKEQIRAMEPFLSETALRKNMSETTQARQLLELAGTPPLPIMEKIGEYLEKAVRGDLLSPEQFEQIGMFLNAVGRMKSYLRKGEELRISLAYYQENLVLPGSLKEEIERCIRGSRVDDYASSYLRDIRKQIQILEEKLAQKAEQALRTYQAYLSDGFVVSRNGRVCIPIKKEWRGKVPGSLIDKSSSGSTLFIEPETVSALLEELEYCRIGEEEEERRVLYELLNLTAESEAELKENIRVVIKLDYAFAKGKLSMELNAAEPKISLDRQILLRRARHPMLNAKTCVPLDFHVGDGVRGIVITGPNTGGKTVAIKTVALLCAMACSGLHIPCEEATVSMNSQILCDIGDGQNISDNLSTFSAHMKNVLEILERADRDSLVILDELGSGTDPTEGMGIAIAVLEQLRSSGALFLVTTHYPDVKEYANRCPEILNARMEFDKESLKPLYRLKIGESGESCALYIAKRLGIPNEMLCLAAKAAYGEQAEPVISELGARQKDGGLRKKKTPSIQRQAAPSTVSDKGLRFLRGDSVTVMPEKKIGIVVKSADAAGNVLVQIQKEKFMVNQKRLALKVAASQLYPEDYDFSILFDSVEVRKARHQMQKRHQEGLEILVEE